MKRRDFVITAAALAAGGGGAFFGQQRLTGTVAYPGRDYGHWLRDLDALPEPTETVDTQVLIAGSGIGGLTAGWQLEKRGVSDVLIVAGPEAQGNAAAARSGDLAYPTGAHYLPLPSMESWHMREMLGDFGIITRDPFGEKPRYDERALVHGPSERVLYRGRWQDGYLPNDGVPAAERADHERFFSIVEQWSAARGDDGRRAFAVPLAQSSTDERYRTLDRTTFRTWLDTVGLASPTLHWYLNYCCRDDYGRRYDEISAWAGLHYFCSRGGAATNAERGAVLTWPQGLAAIADRLTGCLSEAPWTKTCVLRLQRSGAGVEALAVRFTEGAPRVIRIKARHAIAAMPLFVLKHVLADGPGWGFAAGRDVPDYAPWVVANYLMNAFPEESEGVPLAWDNVVHRGPGLGYVVSTHQDIRLGRPTRTAFTAYRALSELTPEAGRGWLERADAAALIKLSSADLRMAYGWRLPYCVERVEVTVRGHAMAIPRPGFLTNAGRLALRDSQGPIYFAHADLSGLSLFEEAAWWGYAAAARIAPRV